MIMIYELRWAWRYLTVTILVDPFVASGAHSFMGVKIVIVIMCEID